MIKTTYQLLFLCTGNSARSILAECVLNRLGKGLFQGFSAGSQPAGQVHPLALQLLNDEGYSTAGLRSKSWDEFAETDAPQFDFVVTLCDSAAQESCPTWLGGPPTIHWGLPDPAAVTGNPSKCYAAFAATHAELKRRITQLVSSSRGAPDRSEVKIRLEQFSAGG